MERSEQTKSGDQSEFISVLVHQLRSSLASVRLAHQALLDDTEGALTKKQKHLLRQAQQRTSRMLYLTDDLLEPDTDARSVFAVKKSSVSIEQLLDSAIEEFSARFADKQLELRRQYGERPQFVSVDREKLLDAVRNLLDNAFKYTPEGGEILVETDYAPRTMTILIADTGIGVPKEKVQQLFTKFTRMENARFIDQSGMGLGLYIVRRIIEEHGGALSYESNTPQGSRFIITLPLSA